MREFASVCEAGSSAPRNGTNRARTFHIVGYSSEFDLPGRESHYNFAFPPDHTVLWLSMCEITRGESRLLELYPHCARAVILISIDRQTTNRDMRIRCRRHYCLGEVQATTVIRQ